MPPALLDRPLSRDVLIAPSIDHDHDTRWPLKDLFHVRLPNLPN